MSEKNPARTLYGVGLICALLFFSGQKDLNALLFPLETGSCGAAVSEQKALFSAVSSCESDEDCAYLNDSFEPILPREFRFEHCTFRVANQIQAIHFREELLTSRDRALQACGRQPAFAQCTGPMRFSSNPSPPVCKDRVCTLPSE